MGLLSWLLGRNKPKKIKIGLALGSGGAKGFAHLGALKAFEENLLVLQGLFCVLRIITLVCLFVKRFWG